MPKFPITFLTRAELNECRKTKETPPRFNLGDVLATVGRISPSSANKKIKAARLPFVERRKFWICAEEDLPRALETLHDVFHFKVVDERKAPRPIDWHFLCFDDLLHSGRCRVTQDQIAVVDALALFFPTWKASRVRKMWSRVSPTLPKNIANQISTYRFQNRSEAAVCYPEIFQKILCNLPYKKAQDFKAALENSFFVNNAQEVKEVDADTQALEVKETNAFHPQDQEHEAEFESK